MLCVIYFVTSVTIPNPQSSDMRHIGLRMIRYMMSAPPSGISYP